MAIGVDTAMNTIVEACDRIADTAGSHQRTFIVEVMGRDCGYLAMVAGLAAQADVVLFPEAEKTESGHRRSRDAGHRLGLFPPGWAKARAGDQERRAHRVRPAQSTWSTSSLASVIQKVISTPA